MLPRRGDEAVLLSRPSLRGDGAIPNKCHATNKCLTSNKKLVVTSASLLGAKGIATRSKDATRLDDTQHM